MTTGIIPFHFIPLGYFSLTKALAVLGKKDVVEQLLYIQSIYRKPAVT